MPKYIPYPHRPDLNVLATRELQLEYDYTPHTCAAPGCTNLVPVLRSNKTGNWARRANHKKMVACSEEHRAVCINIASKKRMLDNPPDRLHAFLLMGGIDLSHLSVWLGRKLNKRGPLHLPKGATCYSRSLYPHG